MVRELLPSGSEGAIGKKGKKGLPSKKICVYPKPMLHSSIVGQSNTVTKGEVMSHGPHWGFGSPPGATWELLLHSDRFQAQGEQSFLV